VNDPETGGNGCGGLETEQTNREQYEHRQLFDGWRADCDMDSTDSSPWVAWTELAETVLHAAGGVVLLAILLSIGGLFDTVRFLNQHWTDLLVVAGGVFLLAYLCGIARSVDAGALTTGIGYSFGAVGWVLLVLTDGAAVDVPSLAGIGLLVLGGLVLLAVESGHVPEDPRRAWTGRKSSD